MRAVIALACAALSACSFVVGTNKYVLGGDAGDATVNDAGNDSSAVDAPEEAPPCSTAGCLAEAGVCGTSCGVTSAACVSGCSNTPCKNNCLNEEAKCRAACAASCNACTVSAGCQDQADCADASAM